MIKISPNTSALPVETKQPQVDHKLEQRLKLKHATEAFESIFIAQLLKNMRSSSISPETDDGFGKDVMMGMADESVSKHLAKTGMIGIGDLLYQHLLHKLELEEALQGEGIDLKIAHRIPRIVAAAPDATSVNRSDSHWKAKYHDLIERAAKDNDLSSKLVEAVISAESGGDPDAISRKGAQGLMQLMPDTASAVGVNDPLNPGENISGGARYLRRMIDRFGDLPLALAAYNAGPSAVERYGGMPPFSETRAYVERIISEISNDN